MSKRIHKVTLPEEERTFLHTYIMTGVRSARSIKRALILLDSDRNRSDPWIAEHQKVSKATVYNIRRRYCSEGLQATLHDKPRSGAPKKLTGREEARFTAIVCSDPPQGRQRWTVRLLADRLVELKLVDGISPSTVGLMLKKTNVNPGKNGNGASDKSAACS